MSTTTTINDNNIKLQLTRVFDAPRELVHCNIDFGHT